MRIILTAKVPTMAPRRPVEYRKTFSTGREKARLLNSTRFKPERMAAANSGLMDGSTLVKFRNLP